MPIKVEQESLPLEEDAGDVGAMSWLTGPRGLLSLGVVVVLLGGVLVWLGGMPGGDSPGAGAGEPAGGLPGGGGDSGDGGSVGGGNGAGAGSGNGGSPTAGDGAAPDSGGAGSGSGAGAGPGSPPPPGGLCGPQEFLGGLVPFVAKLGDPNLLDIPQAFKNVLDNLVGTGIAPMGQVAGPIAGALNAPLTVVTGFNKAYGKLAAELPTECGGISGDPHIVTLDQHYYDFQAVGEYWAFRSEDELFKVQIRTTALLASGRVSTAAGVAAEVDGRVLVVDETAENLVTLDGTALEPENAVFTDNGGAIVYLDDGVAVYWPDDQTTMTLSHLRRSAVSAHFTVGEALQGRVSGLMGNVDGNGDNDIALPDGTQVNDDFETLHGIFADAWRVADAESWFEGPSLYRDDYPSDAASLTSAQRESARAGCVRAGVVSAVALESCMFDVAVSGDATYADIFAGDALGRIPLVDTECELGLGGERRMEGLGPARLWQASDAFRLSTEPAWRFVVEDGRPADVSRVVPLGDIAIVVDTNNGLHMIDAAGAIVRTVELATLPGVEPLVIGDAVIVATEEGLAGIGIDGPICWHLVTHADEDVVTLGMSGDRIIATTEADNGRVSVALAIDPASGEVIWERALQANVRQFGAKAPPALADGVGYFEAAGGSVVALDLDDGEPVWAYEPQRRTNVIHALAATAEGILVASRNSDIVMLASATGEIVWRVASRVSIPIAMAVGATHAVVVGGQGAQAIVRASGEVAWINEDTRLLGLSDQQPVVSQGVVYIYAPDRQLVGLDMETGEEVARLDADLGVSSSNSYEAFVSFPMMLGDVLLAVNLSGDLEAYR